MHHGYKITELNKGTMIYRAAPFISLQIGNGKATKTLKNFAWFAPSEAAAKPYELIIQDHLNTHIFSRIHKYIVSQPLSLIDLSNANTFRKLNHDMKESGYDGLGSSFIIKNGQVKRVTQENQLKRNIKTANELRSFLRNHHPSIYGWRHDEMQRPNGGSQGPEILIFEAENHVSAPAAQGSVAASPVKPQQRSPPRPREAREASSRKRNHSSQYNNHSSKKPKSSKEPLIKRLF